MDDKRLDALFKKHSPEFETQAERVLKRFGGPARFVKAARAAGVPFNRTSVHRWYTRNYMTPSLRKRMMEDLKLEYSPGNVGTNGLIPTQAWPKIFKAARVEGIVLTKEDLDPRPKPRDLNKKWWKREA